MAAYDPAVQPGKAIRELSAKMTARLMTAVLLLALHAKGQQLGGPSEGPGGSSRASAQAARGGQPDWVQVLDKAPFSPRDTAEDLVYDGRMWLSNGWHPPQVLTRDMWCSTDGVGWKLVSDNTPYDGYSEMVAYRGKMWAIKKTVWTSTNGVVWQKVSDATPFGERSYGEAVVWRDRICQLGSGEDVWSTSDGLQWRCDHKSAPYGKRFASAVTVFHDKLWLMAGATPEPNNPPEKGYKTTTTHNDVWCSADGANWTRVVEHAPWAPRQWSAAQVYAGRIWLIGGYDNVNGRNLGDVWTSADGSRWERFATSHAFAPRHEVTPYAYAGSLWVVAGNTWPVVNDVWRLTVQEPASTSRSAAANANGLPPARPGATLLAETNPGEDERDTR